MSCLTDFVCYAKQTTHPCSYLTDNIKMDKIPTKINWKIHALFTLYFKFWKYFLQKVVKYNHQVFYFLLFLLAFTSADVIFQKFLELHTHSKKKIFLTNFLFWTDSHKAPPTPAKSANLDNSFVDAPLFLQNSNWSSNVYIAWNN